MINNTWAEGLGAKPALMSEDQAKVFTMASLAETLKTPLNMDVLNKQFLVQVVDKRIEVMSLPIKFTDHAKLAFLAFCDRPGAVVALLVDCLNAYEGKTVTCEMLAELYPTGFYDEASFGKYVDEYLKPHKVKWAEVYSP